MPTLPLNGPDVALKNIRPVEVARAPNVTLGDGGKLMLASGALLQSWLWKPALGELVDKVNTVPAGGGTGVPSWRVNVTVTITHVPATMKVGPSTLSAAGGNTPALLDIPPSDTEALADVAPEEDALTWDDPALPCDVGALWDDPGVDDDGSTPLVPPLPALEAMAPELAVLELGPLVAGPLDGSVLVAPMVDPRLLPEAPVAADEDPPTLTPPEDVVVVLPGWHAPSTQLSVTEHCEALLQDRRHSPSRSTCALGQVVWVQETAGAPSATTTNSQPKCRIPLR